MAAELSKLNASKAETRQFSGSIWETHEKAICRGASSSRALYLVTPDILCKHMFKFSWYRNYSVCMIITAAFLCTVSTSTVSKTVITLHNTWAYCGFTHKSKFIFYFICEVFNILFIVLSTTKDWTNYFSRKIQNNTKIFFLNDHISADA